MKKKLRGPNFFIIAAPKCGTTAMANFLDQHPEVYFSKPKEPMFFSSDVALTVHYKTIKKYLKYCFSGVNSNHKAIGDGSVNIIYSKTGIKRILEYCTQAKFILMLRNPIDAAISMHGYTFNFPKKRQDISENFEVCWKKISTRRQKGILPLIHQYDELYSYHKHLKKLFSLVDKQQIHIIIYDDFKKDAMAEYKKLCNFLKISDQFEPKIRIINKRSRKHTTKFFQFISYIANLTYNIRHFFHLNSLGIMEKISEKHKEPFSKPRLSPEFLAEMKAFFQEDIIKTSKLINRDLSMWL